MAARQSTRLLPREKDLTGQTFGRWKVLGFAKVSKGHRYWLCRCKCGKQKPVEESGLKLGRSTGCISCGRQPFEDLTGQTFGEFFVIGFKERRGRCYFWKCRCSCGKRRVISGAFLKNGKWRSCGHSAPLDQRLEEKTIKYPGGCWEWTGCRNRKGYGVISLNGKNVSVHRLVYRRTFGRIPRRLYVLHRCDNPPCCRPDHLWLGTHLDNMRDMVRKGRQATGRCGETNHNAKMTTRTVKEIRRDYSHGDIGQHGLAARYHTSRSNIQAIVSGRNWRHLLLEEEFQ